MCRCADVLCIWPDPQPHIDRVCHPLEKQPINVNIDPETRKRLHGAWVRQRV